MDGGPAWDPGLSFTIWVWSSADVGIAVVLLRLGLRFWRSRWLFAEDVALALAALMGLAAAAVWQVYGRALVDASAGGQAAPPMPAAAPAVAYLSIVALWLLKVAVLYAAWCTCSFRRLARVAWWLALVFSVGAFAAVMGSASYVCPYATSPAARASCASPAGQATSYALLVWQCVADLVNNLLVLFFPLALLLTGARRLEVRILVAAAAVVLQGLDSAASFARLLSPTNAPLAFALLSVSLGINIILASLVTIASDDAPADPALQSETDSILDRADGAVFQRVRPLSMGISRGRPVSMGAARTRPLSFGPSVPTKRVVTMAAIKDDTGPAGGRGGSSRSSVILRGRVPRPRSPAAESLALSEVDTMLPLQGTRPSSQEIDPTAPNAWSDPLPPPPAVAQPQQSQQRVSSRAAASPRPPPSNFSTPDRRAVDRRPAGRRAAEREAPERRPAEARALDEDPLPGNLAGAHLRSWHDGRTATAIWDQYRRAANMAV